MKVDDGLVQWFLDKVENHDSKKAKDLKRFLKHSGTSPTDFASEAIQGAESLQQVADDLLIDNPPDRSNSPGS